MNINRILPWLSLAAFVSQLAFAGPELSLVTPAEASELVGATARFQIKVTKGTAPYAYQWWHGSTLIDTNLNPSGAKLVLSITNVTLADAGEYSVVATDATGSTKSTVATLRVDPTFQKIASGPIATDSAGHITGTWLDYDKDGYLDLYVANSILSGTVQDALYHNNKNGTFTKVTNAITLNRSISFSGAVADVDEDGNLDLFVVHATTLKDSLYFGGGKGDFVSGPGIVSNESKDESVSSAWSDVDGDGYLDLLTANGYGKQQPNGLNRNLGNRMFRPMSAAEVGDILGEPSLKCFCNWADFDNDGAQDALVCDADGQKRLSRNVGNYKFVSVDAGSLTSSMANGVGCWGDYNNDGFLDFFQGSYSDGTPTLHRNLTNGTFTNANSEAGFPDLAIASVFSGTWGDYDNDGYLDLFGCSYEGKCWLFHNRGDGTFESTGTGSLLSQGTRRVGPAWADYDNDGFLDLFVACGDAVPNLNQLYRNNLPAVGNTNHWLKVKLTGKASNQSAIGAKVRVKATMGGRSLWQVREVNGNDGFSGGQPLILHFGLGDATAVEAIRVEWPSGNVQETTSGSVDRLVPITEPVRIQPVRPSASPGGEVTLTNSYPTGTYQWQFNGVDLPGETNKTLSLHNLQTTQAGRYSVVITRMDGTIWTNHTHLGIDTQFTLMNDQPMMQITNSTWGCAWIDYDKDGYSDLFVAGSGGPIGTNWGYSHCSLFRNNRDGTFTAMTVKDVGDLVGNAFFWYGCSWGDYDNDGNIDLLVAGMDLDLDQPGSLFYRNNGDGTFTSQPQLAPFLTDGVYFQSAAWADYDRDGYLDLAAASGGHYDGIVYRNCLAHNDGEGAFTQVTAGPIPNDDVLSTELVAWGDYDGDGWPDLVIPDPGASRIMLYHNVGNGEFECIRTNAIGSYPGTNSNGELAYAPTWADYDNDGRLDLFLACFNGTSVLFHNEGGGQFTSIPFAPAPLGRQTGTGSAAWADYDNDGYLDLFIPRAIKGVNSLLYHNNRDGTFTEVRTGSLPNDLGESHTAAWGDYDNDGSLDLFVTRARTSRPFLYHNNGNSNSWLQVKLNGTASNRSAIGAKVRLTAKVFGKTITQMRELSAGNRAQDDLRAHFGLGDATNTLALKIEWPSGTVQTFNSVTANQILTIWEPPVLRAKAAADGTCVLSITAEPNRPWEIEASIDLVEWRILTTLTSTTANLCYTDRDTMACRFYRVKSP